MDVRDRRLLGEVESRPFAGYARREVAETVVAERVLACFALLLTMVVSGILLGSGTQRR